MQNVSTAKIDGARLRIARETAGYSQSQVAEKIGVTKETVSNYENNYGKPSANMLVRLCMLYQIDARHLIAN